MDYRNGSTDELNGESDGNTSFLRAARAGHLDKVLEHLKSNIDINTSNANGLNALHLSSKDGHVTVVEELLRRGALVDSATKKGNTALHIASLAGQEEVVKLLVQHGATVNVQSQNGFTPLYMAAQENHDNVVRYLLANGANQTLATEDGFTPLAVAMQQGHDKVVTVLLESDTRGKVRLPALHIAAKKDDCKAAKLLLENEHNPDVTSKSGFTPLHIASHYGNDAIGHLLIQKGADANYAAKHNITPLHVAAKWGKTNMVALLLEKGATIEAKTRDGLTPLHCAARSGHEQVVDMLVERGAPISCKTKNGLAPLHMAAQGDHVDAARILLYHRAPVDEVTVDYLTALHVAAHCGHVRVAKLLLDRQADANARALNGFTPLHIACKKNRIKVVELLLKHGASIGATTESGLTPLHVASFMGCMNIVIYLLQHDANPDVPTVRGETPLHLAARANQTDIIRILLRNGAQVDARAREQQTPLHIASRLGNVDIVMLLLQHGAKVDTATKDMYTALHIAAKEGQDEVTAVLIDNGASLNATTKKGFTPLHLAAKYGQIKVAKLLLQKEASVDTQGKNGVTPLHVAAHYDHQNVALLLLDKGASPHASAKNGHTPLHIAAKKNQMDIANTLLEYGARPSAESKAGFTPLHLSAQEGHSDMSALLVEHQADVNQQSKNGLTALHLCAQEDRVPVAEMLVKNGANIESATKAGFTPLHVASHYGQANMVRFLLGQGADVQATTSIGYTPLHQTAQQGHTNIVNILLEKGAEPNSTTSTGQTPLGIAQKLGYINVIETLKTVTTTTTTTTSTEEKYKVIAPEAMQETFMSDSEEEGGEDTMLGDNAYRYLTADEMKSLGDDSLPIDVTRDERIDSNKMALSGDANSMPPQAFEDSISPQHFQPNYTSAEYNNTRKYVADNVDIARHPINIGFLVSFLVDARGGAMRGCRHSGVRVIVPPRSASSPTRITCRYVRPQRTPHPPPLMEGEALASRVLELGPVGSRFLGPVIIEVPHFAALRGKEREIVILRSDNGETWREHNIDQAEEILNDVLHDSFEAEDLSQMEDIASGRITRILTHDFPQYFAVVSRIRQEVHAIGPEGGMVSSTVVPQVQAVFPPGALTKKIKVGLQAQPIDPELTAKLLGHGVAVSPVVTVEPRRRKFHKAITLSMPAPRAHSQGMINQYSGSAPTLRLLCSITGGTTRAQWEDVTGSTPLTFVNECVSFTTTVSARFWLMDCRNIQDAAKMATELYREAIHVPFMAKFVVFAKRVDPLEARLRVFCMTDDKEDKTLEHQEHFIEVAKSRDVEALEGKPQYIEFAGNLIPITKSGEQLQFAFRAFRENRLPFSVRVKDQHAEAIGRSMFMKEPKVAKGEPPQQPICILNIVLPEDIVADTISLTDFDSSRRHEFLKDGYESYRPDPRISDMSNLLGEDWVALANQLGLTSSEINVIKSEYPDSVAKQAQSMLRMWIAQSGNRAQSNILEVALRRIGREEIIPQCLTIDPATIERVSRPIERLQEAPKFRVKKETSQEEKDMMKDSESVESLIREDKSKKRESFDKYSAEEKVVEEPSEEEEEDFNVTVTERRVQIEKRLSQERQIPASTQRVEIVQEISSIKRQSLVEDKIMQVEKIITDDVKPPMPSSDSSQSIKTTSTVSTTASTVTTVTMTSAAAQPEIRKETDLDDVVDNLDRVEVAPIKEQDIVEVHTHKPDYEDMYDNDKAQEHLLEAVSHGLEVTSDNQTKKDGNLHRLSRTPPPSPADFLLRDQAAALEDRGETERSILEQVPMNPDEADDNEAVETKLSEAILDGSMVVNIDKKPRKSLLKNIKAYISKSFDTDGIKKRSLFGRQKSVQSNIALPMEKEDLKTSVTVKHEITEKDKRLADPDEYSRILEKANTLVNDIVTNSEKLVNSSQNKIINEDEEIKFKTQKSRNRTISFSESNDIANSERTIHFSSNSAINGASNIKMKKQGYREKSVSFSGSDDVLTNSQRSLNSDDNMKIKKQRSREKSVSFTGSDDHINFLNDVINDIQDELISEDFMLPLRKQSIVEELIDEESEPLISTPKFLTEEEHKYMEFQQSNENISYSSSETDNSYMNLYNPQEGGYCKLIDSIEFDKTRLPDLIDEPDELSNLIKVPSDPREVKTQQIETKSDHLDPLAMMPTNLITKFEKNKKCDNSTNSYQIHEVLSESLICDNQKIYTTEVLPCKDDTMLGIGIENMQNSVVLKILERSKKDATKQLEIDNIRGDSKMLLSESDIEERGSCTPSNLIVDEMQQCSNLEDVRTERHLHNQYEPSQSSASVTQSVQKEMILGMPKLDIGNDITPPFIFSFDIEKESSDINVIPFGNNQNVAIIPDSVNKIATNVENVNISCSNIQNSIVAPIEMNKTPNVLKMELDLQQAKHKIEDVAVYKIMYDQKEILEIEPLLIDPENYEDKHALNADDNYFQADSVNDELMLPIYNLIFDQNDKLETEPLLSVSCDSDVAQLSSESPKMNIHVTTDSSLLHRMPEGNNAFSEQTYKIMYDENDKFETEPLLGASVDSKNMHMPSENFDVIVNNSTDSNLYQRFSDINCITPTPIEIPREGELNIDEHIIQFEEFPKDYENDFGSFTGSSNNTIKNNNNGSFFDSYTNNVIGISKSKTKCKESDTTVGHDFGDAGYNFFQGYDDLLHDNNISLPESISERLNPPANLLSQGMSSQGESSQAIRSEQELQKEDQSKSQSQTRQVKDQQELSQEMRDILKALDEDSYK